MLFKLIGLFKKIVFVIWLLLIAMLGAWIAVENPQPFSLSLPLVVLPTFSVGVYLCIVLAFGVVLGFFTSYLAITSRLYLAARQLKKANKQIDLLTTQKISEPLKIEKPHGH